MEVHALFTPSLGGVALAAKVLLVLVTIVCLLSMGGAMMFAAPVLVPLHVFAARRTGPKRAGGWVFLAALSLFELGWMWTYVATENDALSAMVGALAAVIAMVVLLRDLADRSTSLQLGVAANHIRS
jgi:hypothetical protein